MKNEEKFGRLLAKFYDHAKMPFDALDMEIYEEGLKDVGFEAAYNALKEIAASQGLSKIPTVKQILQKCGLSDLDPEEVANLGAGKIIEAVAKFGGYRAIEAQGYLGPELWSAVTMSGGWENLCMMDNDQLPTIRAQLRQLLKATKSHNQHQKALSSQKNPVIDILDTLNATVISLNPKRG